jgi:hypothetical protein
LLLLDRIWAAAHHYQGHQILQQMLLLLLLLPLVVAALAAAVPAVILQLICWKGAGSCLTVSQPCQPQVLLLAWCQC